jgi:hypothetical protein
MQQAARFGSRILVWRYQALAEEALAFARAVKDPGQRRLFEDLATTYLKLASHGPAEPVPVRV